MLHENDVETFVNDFKVNSKTLGETAEGEQEQKKIDFAIFNISHKKNNPNCLVSNSNWDELVDESIQKQFIEVKLFNHEVNLSNVEIDLFFKDMSKEDKEKWLKFIKTYSLEKHDLDEKSFDKTLLGKKLLSE